VLQLVIALVLAVGPPHGHNSQASARMSPFADLPIRHWAYKAAREIEACPALGPPPTDCYPRYRHGRRVRRRLTRFEFAIVAKRAVDAIGLPVRDHGTARQTQWSRRVPLRVQRAVLGRGSRASADRDAARISRPSIQRVLHCLTMDRCNGRSAPLCISISI